MEIHRIPHAQLDALELAKALRAEDDMVARLLEAAEWSVKIRAAFSVCYLDEKQGIGSS